MTTLLVEQVKEGERAKRTAAAQEYRALLARGRASSLPGDAERLPVLLAALGRKTSDLEADAGLVAELAELETAEAAQPAALAAMRTATKELGAVSAWVVARRLEHEREIAAKLEPASDSHHAAHGRAMQISMTISALSSARPRWFALVGG